MKPRFTISLIMSLGIVFPATLHAQEPPPAEPAPAETEAAEEAATAQDTEIPLEILRARLRPRSKVDLEVELTAWLERLEAKISEVVSTEIEIANLNAAEASPADAQAQITALEERLVQQRTDEASIKERVAIVIEAFTAKGGDASDATNYVAAVSDLSNAVDTSSRWAALIAAARSWLSSPEGGRLLALRFGLALLVLGIFWILSRYTGRVVGKIFARQSSISDLLTDFGRRTAGGLTLAIGLLMAIATLGIPIAPLIAALGAGGFIVGFALQETLGNFASGMMIMIYRPFDVRDYVKVAGVEGTVQEMSLVSTTLLTLDNKVLIIPNRTVWSDTITNFTGRDLRRVDLVFGIGYGDDIPKAMATLKEVASAHEKVLQDPPLAIEVVELGDSSVNIACRPWTETPNYWAVYWDLTRDVKLRFDQEGISIPFPQRDVHLIGGNA